MDEKVIYVLNPDAGYGQAGASKTRASLKRMTGNSRSAREDIDLHLSTLRQRSRILFMSSSIASAAIKICATSVIGRGLIFKPAPDAAVLGLSDDEAMEWRLRTEREFSRWAESKRNCDVSGIDNFYGIQRLAFISKLLSGDVFVLFKREKPETLRPDGLRLQLIEADRVRTPNAVYPGVFGTYNGNAVFDGVEVDDGGKAIAFHISDSYPGTTAGQSDDFRRVLAYGTETGLPNILQIMTPERPGQYRGVPYLAPVIETILQLRRYSSAELDAAVVQSYFTGFVRTNADPTSPVFNQTQPTNDNEEGRLDMGPADIYFLKPGEDIVFGNPTHPNGNYAEYVRAKHTEIGAALVQPRDMLTLDFSTSYNASRAAILEFWKDVRMKRSDFVHDFCEPVYEVWLADAVASGRISAPGFFDDPTLRRAWLKADWVGPSQPMLDPTKEIKAEADMVANGFSDREQSTIRLNGGDWDANMARLKREQAVIADTFPPEMTDEQV